MNEIRLGTPLWVQTFSKKSSWYFISEPKMSQIFKIEYEMIFT